jgi:predicted amidohydrolase YtcJ
VRKLITMNPALPLATHLAVRGGLILGAGDLDRVSSNRRLGPMHASGYTCT